MYCVVRFSNGRRYWVLVPQPVQAAPPSPLALAVVEGLKIVGRVFWHQMTEEARTIRRDNTAGDVILKTIALPFFEAFGKQLDHC